MSTTSEYYIRNMSMNEFRRFHERLQKEERKKTRKELKSTLDKEIKTALKSESKLREGQRKAMQKQLDKLTKENRQQVECNQRMMQALEERLAVMKREGDAEAALVEESIRLLGQEQQSLEREIGHLNSQTQELERSISVINERLSTEIKLRQDAQKRATGYYSGLKQLYRQRHLQIDERSCVRYHLHTELRTMEHNAHQANDQHQNGIQGAAASTIAQCLTQVDELQRKLSDREDEERAHHFETQLHLESCRTKLKELNIEDVRQYLGATVDQLNERLNTLKQHNVKEIDCWDERRAHHRQLKRDMESLEQDISSLYLRYDELVEQAAHRESILKGLVQALVEVWGGEYEMDAYLENPEDLSSPLIFRTKRGPYAPNVQAVIGIDGRMEANLTGYHGVECAQDEEQLRQALSRRSRVEVVRTQHELKPDTPNPEDSGPSIAQPKVSMNRSPSTQARPQWMRKTI